MKDLHHCGKLTTLASMGRNIDRAAIFLREVRIIKSGLTVMLWLNLGSVAE
jgi:hypothetical protein